jgi:hypothetical protein
MKETKAKFSNVTAVRTDIIKKEVWLRIRRKKADQKCSNCSGLYSDSKGEVSLLMRSDGSNKHTCLKCAQLYIDRGAEDSSRIILNINAKKESLISEINNTGLYRKGYCTKDLKEMSITELEETAICYSKKKELKDYIDSIVISKEDSKIDEYLIKDHSVIQNTEYLKCQEQIEDYFKDCGRDYFDCGQGYYQDIHNQIIKIKNKYFMVYIFANIGSAKQDIGDRLYWVDSIERVEYNEIEKPEPIERENFTLTLSGLSNREKEYILDFVKDNEWEVEIS